MKKWKKVYGKHMLVNGILYTEMFLYKPFVSVNEEGKWKITKMQMKT